MLMIVVRRAEWCMIGGEEAILLVYSSILIVVIAQVQVMVNEKESSHLPQCLQPVNVMGSNISGQVHTSVIDKHAISILGVETCYLF